LINNKHGIPTELGLQFYSGNIRNRELPRHTCIHGRQQHLFHGILFFPLFFSYLFYFVAPVTTSLHTTLVERAVTSVHGRVQRSVLVPRPRLIPVPQCSNWPHRILLGTYLSYYIRYHISFAYFYVNCIQREVRLSKRGPLLQLLLSVPQMLWLLVVIFLCLFLSLLSHLLKIIISR
jgi:hypothetical protein